MSNVSQPSTNRVVRYTVTRRLTRGNVRGGAQASRWYSPPMQIIARDLDVVRLVGAFQQLTARHIEAAVFDGLKSRTTHNRVLRRLVHDKLLHRLNRRLPGGPLGGSPQYVYTLGPEGWRLFSTARWYPPTSVNYHTLAIADTYVSLLEHERAGDIIIRRVATEPESHEIVKGADLRPDLVVQFGIPSRRVDLTMALEIDLDTEKRPKQIRDKLDRFAHAAQHSTADEIEVLPLVVFLAPDTRRVAWLQRIIDQAGYKDEAGNPRAVAFKQTDFPGCML